MPKKNEGGYSLLEVGLALSVGILLMGAAVYGYRSLREQSGDANMRQKVQDLQSLVEELYAARFAYPTADTLRDVWKARRPDDYRSSPWGGPVLGLIDSDKGILSYALNHGNTTYHKERTSSSAGAVHYVTVDNAGQPGSVDLWDMTRGSTVSVRAYAVAGDKIVNGSGRLFFHVQGGR
ncbi:hypothetical protein D3C87_931140 [compost metagenome]